MTTDPIQHLIDAAKAVTAVGRRDYGDLTDEMKDAVMALVALWEIATELADFTYSDSQAEAIERIGGALRRLEELKP